MKEILTYLTLVGLPILGLVGILRLGHSLDASPAVHGLWVADSTGAPEPCRDGVLRSLRVGITVEQSGRHLAASLAEDREQSLSGRIADDTVTLSGWVTVSGSEGATCEPRTRLALTLRLMAPEPKRRLSGVARIADCVTCQPLPVMFTIVPASAIGVSPAAHR